ncbi:MAG: ankyrin repeat domain-containing protein [Acidobacteriota bacterium]
MRALVIAVILLTACYAASDSQFTDLANSARAGDVAKIRELAAEGADPNAVAGQNNWTPLLHAIHKHQNASVTALLGAGADVNRAGHDGVTPLMMAAGYGFDDTVQLLLKRGANASLKGSEEGSALDWALLGTTDIDRFTYFTCQDSTVRLLRSAAPTLQPTAGARRWAKMKRCATSS